MISKDNTSITPINLDWTSDHTGPKKLKLVYVTNEDFKSRRTYLLLKSKKKK